MEKNNSNDIYAILLGLFFLCIIFFILTLSFWEKSIYNIFLFDNQIATLINKYFPQYYSDYKDIYNLIQFVEIPKFEWLKLTFTYDENPEYINILYNYYYYLHIIYGTIIFLLSYFLVNNFHLIPTVKFQNNFLYKQKLIEEAKKRIKIKNKKLILYKNMDVLIENKREIAEIGAAGQFLNCDYYLPFITIDMIGSNSSSNNISENFVDVNIINTNRRYINDSLYFSNHYINYYYHEYILNNIKINNNTVIALLKMDKIWNNLKKEILKKNNIQDLYYYSIITYYNDDIININDTFISLFLIGNEDFNNKNYLVLFNNFLKNYKIKMKLVYKYNTVNIEQKKSPYIMYTTEEKYSNYKEMQKYEFIIEDKYILNLEEFYVYLKIKLFSFSLNKTYFFNSDEDKVISPILTIPPSEKTDVEIHNINEIENIKKLIASLQNIHLKEFSDLEIIKNNIDEYNDFKNSYNKYIEIIFNNSENNSLQNKLINLLNKTLITKDKKQLSVKEILNKKYYEHFYNVFIQKNCSEFNILNYLKEIKIFIKLYYKNCKKLYTLGILDKSFTEDIEDIKSHYLKLYENIKLLLEDKDNLTDIIEIEKQYLKKVLNDLKFFMNSMITKIILYYQYNLQYNKEDNKNEIHPAIGQPIMPSFYILTPFIYSKSDNNFNKIKDFKVNGYKKYIYPVFEEIYDTWYNKIEDLIKFYNKKISNVNKKDINETEITLKLKLLKQEAIKQKSSSSSIETKLLDIFEIHHFEETIIIALWKSFTKLENLPTTKLSNLKYDNLVLWYALTSIGDVVIDSNIKSPAIGRPFDFNAGLPILLMYELEIENFKRKINNKDISKHNLDEKE